MRTDMSRKFVVLSIVFNICLIASNLFDIKIFTATPLTLTGGLLIFPVVYIINDCLTEVWGYRNTRYVIWTAFIASIFFTGLSQLVRILPASPIWDGQEHFDYIFAADLRITCASLLAFLAGSLSNSLIMDRMRRTSRDGHGFGWRAVISSLAGESLDSIIFFPIAFCNIAVRDMLVLMVTQILLKTMYEIIVLPVTAAFVRRLKATVR